MTRTGAYFLDELRAVDEPVTTEAKTASKIDRSVLESVCAFTEEPGLGGGYLLLGVRGVAHVGAKDAAVRVFDFDTLEGKAVLVVFVPELQAGDLALRTLGSAVECGVLAAVAPTLMTVGTVVIEDPDAHACVRIARLGAWSQRCLKA